LPWPSFKEKIETQKHFRSKRARMGKGKKWNGIGEEKEMREKKKKDG